NEKCYWWGQCRRAAQELQESQELSSTQALAVADPPGHGDICWTSVSRADPLRTQREVDNVLSAVARECHGAKLIGRVGAELDVEAGRKAGSPREIGGQRRQALEKAVAEGTPLERRHQTIR